MGTPCPIDPARPASYPGNSYYCPDINEDGTPNAFTECCHNDRADEDGNYHSCCQSTEEASAERLGMMEKIGMYVAIATGIVIVLVFFYTYCRDDTFSCLGRMRARINQRWDRCIDGICFCRCCPKKFRRKLMKKKRAAEKQYLPESTSTDPEARQDDFFW